MQIHPTRIYEPGAIKGLIFEFLIEREEGASDELRSVMKAHVDPATANPGIDIMGMLDIMERIYAAKETAGPVLMQIGAAIATTLAVYQSATMRERASGIGQALKREAGILPPEGYSWPTADQDPAPRLIQAEYTHPLAYTLENLGV